MATRVESLHAGDELPTASETVAEVEHFDGSLTRLDAGAVARLGRLADPDGRPHVVITLGPGDSWHRTSGESSRHGQYEAHTPSAVAMARDAVFVVRTADDGAAWFAALHGAVVVRGHAGGTVVLHAGEAVTASVSGAMGDVARVGLDGLADDDWVAVNDALDAAPAVDDDDHEADAITPKTEPTAGAPAPVGTVEAEPDADRDHPWRVGVASVLAIGLGIFSVIIGRSAVTPPDRDDSGPAAVVPGPPAFAGPAVATPGTDAPTSTDTEVADTRTTAVPARYDVDGRSCSRRAGAVHYTGTVRNDDAVARDYTVEVRFVDRSDTTVATATTTVNGVPAGATRSFHVTGTGAGLRLATDCEVGTVSVG
jgi:hypothetical protein